MEPPIRRQNRLKEYDYSTPNAYFITVCTDKRKNLFWANTANLGFLQLSPYGVAVEDAIKGIAKHYPAVSVDNYVIMPNHIHLLLQIHADSDGRSMIAPTISTVVRQMKGVASKEAGFSLWQKGFYDHVIRNETDYLEIWKYIEGNPSRWLEDKLYAPSFHKAEESI